MPSILTPASPEEASTRQCPGSKPSQGESRPVLPPVPASSRGGQVSSGQQFPSLLKTVWTFSTACSSFSFSDHRSCLQKSLWPTGPERTQFDGIHITGVGTMSGTGRCSDHNSKRPPQHDPLRPTSPASPGMQFHGMGGILRQIQPHHMFGFTCPDPIHHQVEIRCRFSLFRDGSIV